MTLSVRATADGCTFAVKAVPGAARDRIAGLYGDAVKVAVAAPPEGGKANARICAVLAAALGIAERDIAVTQGASSPRKTVSVRGVDPATVAAKLLARP